MTRTHTLPAFVRELLASPPRRGDGLNSWFFRTSRVLHPFLPRAEIIELLQVATYGEPLQPGEVKRAVERSAACAWKPGELSVREEYRPAHPELDQQFREAVIAQEGVTLSELAASSPEAVANDAPRAESIVDAIFPGNPLLCVAKSVKEAATRPRETWRGHLARLPLMVPNPMKAGKGRTQDGRESERCLNNTGARRFLVVEQDQGTNDEQAAILCHLAKFLPLAVVVHSGRRSLHGWFFVEGLPVGRVEQFMDLACRLGADNALRNPCQLVRIPDGTRDTGERQRVLFFNPEALRAQSAAGICHEPEIPTLAAPAASAAPQNPKSAPTREARDEPAAPAPYPWPEDIATLLRDPPRYGQGLLPWIKLMAIRMLATGADPPIIAGALHLATRDQEFSSAELRALKSVP